jgi:large subunit ribosomal protein L35
MWYLVRLGRSRWVFKRVRDVGLGRIETGLKQKVGPMPKLKTHKGIKKRFKVSATGKVSHKRCGSSHLMSHKSGSQVRKLRKKSTLKISAEAHRMRRALHKNVSSQPVAIEDARLAFLADRAAEGETPAAPV